KVGDKQLLKPATIEEMFRPQFENSRFGLGFMVRDLDGKKRVGHGGASYGVATEWAARPGEKLGVVGVCSRDVANGVMGRIADDAFRLMLAAKAGKPLPKIEHTQPIPTELARKLVGTYDYAGNRFEITESFGRVYMWPVHTGPRVQLRQFNDAII